MLRHCISLVCSPSAAEAEDHETGRFRKGHWKRRVLRIPGRSARNGNPSSRWCEKSRHTHLGHSDKSGGVSGKNRTGPSAEPKRISSNGFLFGADEIRKSKIDRLSNRRFRRILGMRPAKRTLGYILSVPGARCEAKPRQNCTLSQSSTAPITGRFRDQNKRISIRASTWYRALRWSGTRHRLEHFYCRNPHTAESTVLADFVPQRRKCFLRGLIACLVFNHLLTSFCSSAEVPV